MLWQGIGLRRLRSIISGRTLAGLLPSSRRTLHVSPSLRVHASTGQYDGRNRLSAFWAPTQSRKPSNAEDSEPGHDLLVRAGFLRQAHSGIFHLLPLGLRVQDKIERLIDKHMQRLGASKVSLSSLSSQELWLKSGRLDGRNAEFFRLEDRKEAKFLLSPTHEEEITTIVKHAVHSYKDLPLRLYQVSRKYRDEARPRQGLLRGREFVMKDLYTFDLTDEQARQTYEQVRRAYRDILNSLALPYLVANADSGNMGGSLSHEYHFVSPKGEDTIIHCRQCGSAVNEELDRGRDIGSGNHDTGNAVCQPSQPWIGLSKDRTTTVKVYFPVGDYVLNLSAIKRLFPGLDASIDSPTSAQLGSGTNTVVLVDPRVSMAAVEAVESGHTAHYAKCLLTKARTGDSCTECGSNTVTLRKAVEIGHTFHLSTRYSKPLEAQVVDADNKQNDISMGCHGIGVSRLIGVVASLLADTKGLNWPTQIAPFTAALIAASHVQDADVQEAYDQLYESSSRASARQDWRDSDLELDHEVIIDDRDRSLGWKLKDADLIGFPFIIVLGKAWDRGKIVELQCRQLAVKEEVALGRVWPRMEQLAADLRKLSRDGHKCQP